MRGGGTSHRTGRTTPRCSAGIAAARHALVAEAGCDRGVDCASDDEPERERRVFDLAQSLFDRVEAATIVLRGKPVTLVRWLARLRQALGSVAALEPLRPMRRAPRCWP